MNKLTLIIVWTVMLQSLAVSGQVYMTRNATVRFFSEAPLENIEAVNRQVNSALNIETGEFVFRVLMRAFAFEKSLMQEHFNDNFVESHKYPNATFQGLVKNVGDIDFSVDDTHLVEVEGELTIKDVTRPVQVGGTLKVSGGMIHGEAVFYIHLPDYNVHIPARYSRNISRDIEITVQSELQPR